MVTKNGIFELLYGVTEIMVMLVYKLNALLLPAIHCTVATHYRKYIAPFTHKLKTISRKSDRDNVQIFLFTHVANITRLSRCEVFTYIGSRARRIYQFADINLVSADVKTVF